jgi:hypothetical protein
MSKQPLSATLYKLYDPSNTGIVGSPLYRRVPKKCILEPPGPGRLRRHMTVTPAARLRDIDFSSIDKQIMRQNFKAGKKVSPSVLVIVIQT